MCAETKKESSYCHLAKQLNHTSTINNIRTSHRKELTGTCEPFTTIIKKTFCPMTKYHRPWNGAQLKDKSATVVTLRQSNTESNLIKMFKGYTGQIDVTPSGAISRELGKFVELVIYIFKEPIWCKLFAIYCAVHLWNFTRSLQLLQNLIGQLKKQFTVTLRSFTVWSHIESLLAVMVGNNAIACMLS